jgi:hypothetical protein
MILRESYVQAAIAALDRQSGFGGMPWPSELDPGRTIDIGVERSMVLGFDGDEVATLVVHQGVDDPVTTDLGCVTNIVEIMVTAIVRDPMPDVLANQLFEISHPVIMGLVGLASLIQIEKGRTDAPMFTTADPNAVFLTMHYAFTYQTQPDSLSE